MHLTTLTHGIWNSSGSVVFTELAADCGFDWVLLDMEHGQITDDSLYPHLLALKGTPTKGIVRIGDITPNLISRALDWGAAGIMAPHVSTPQKALECIRCMYYPPDGVKGYSSSARRYHFGLDRPDIENFKPIFMAQIEDTAGIENAHAIAAIPEVTALFIGPSDLSLHLSANPQWDFQNALEHIAKTTRLAGKQAGILLKKAGELPVMLQLGYTCIAVGSDVGFLRNAMVESLSGFKSPES